MTDMRILFISIALGILIIFSLYPLTDSRQNYIVESGDICKNDGDFRDDINDDFKGGFKIHEQRGPYHAVTRHGDE